MPQVVSAEHQSAAQRFKQLWTRYQQSRDLISVGAYVSGGDKDTDFAIERYPYMSAYLRQGLNDTESMANSTEQLLTVLNPEPVG